MTENVDGYLLEWTETEVVLKFTDRFGDGEAYSFPIHEAEKIRDALTAAVLGRRTPGGKVVTAEPSDVGTIVVDGNGDEWVRVYYGGGPAPWHRTDWASALEPWSVWSAIPAPTEVL
jgi:hypothetical protein